MTRPGLLSLKSSYPSPQRSMVPGRKFSTTTSAPAIKFRASSCPSSSRKFKVTDFLLRAMIGHHKVWPFLRWRPHSRMGSPFPGGSTFITSAPKSARSWPQNGPASRLPISTTRTPSSGELVPFLASVILYFLQSAGPGTSHLVDVFALPKSYGNERPDLRQVSRATVRYRTRHTSQRSVVARAARAAKYPHMPCTPPPGGVEEEQR